MKRNLLITAVLLALLPRVAQAQWTFDIVSVEAYINDHKKQRSLLLARSTLEYSNQLLHEYSRKEVGGYKELNVDLDRYTRAFDVIDVMYQSLRTVLNVKDSYEKTHSIAVALDGPLGPRHEPKKLAFYLSEHAEEDFVGITVSYSSCIRLWRRWDRYVIPLPWSTVDVSVRNYGVVRKDCIPELPA